MDKIELWPKEVYDQNLRNLLENKNSDQNLAQMAEEALQQIQDSEDAINEAAPEIYDSALKLPYREPERIGDADPAGGWGKYAFYFKNSGEYQASGYTLYESRWQQRVRMFGGSSENWTENPVVYREEPTYPYPGKDIWTEGEGFKEVDLLFYSVHNGPDPSIEDKKNPGTESGKAPDGNYPIIG